MRILDPRYETLPRAELEQLQLERLQALLARLKRNVRRCREQIADTCVENLQDLPKLPFTTPDDMVESFPYGMFAQPLREVIRLRSIAGPQGKPLVIGHTRNDLAQWGRLAARQLVASGATSNDVVQVCLGGGIYRGDSGYVLGAESIEASVIAEEPFHIDAQFAMLQNYRPTMLITTPTNAVDLMRMMERRRIDPQSFHLRTILLSRPVDPAMRQELHSGLLVAVQCNFGIDEILDPGLCVECEANRFHVNEDHFLVEVVDGELVVTTLTREAMPLLRYRTRVACEARREKCSCGRTGIVLVPGQRLDRRLRVRETPLYESQIAEVLALSRAVGRPFRFEVDERSLRIFVEINEELFSDVMAPIERLQKEIESDFLTRLGVEAHIQFVSPTR